MKSITTPIRIPNDKFYSYLYYNDYHYFCTVLNNKGMKDYFYLNPSKMLELSRKLSGSETKMLYGIMYCLAVTGDEKFTNDADNRRRIAEIGFDRTRERFGFLLSSLVRKEVLRRESQGVYSLPEGLFIDANKIEEKCP